MRILHISTRLILGGSQENTVLSCEEQARRGHDVHLAFGPIFGPEGSMRPRVEAFNHNASATGTQPISLHEVPALIREVRPSQDLRAKRSLTELIERLSPDVVHTHSSKAGIVGRLAAWSVKERRGGSPRVIHTIHGPPFMPVEGSPARRFGVRIMNGVYAAAERKAALHCDAIISVADAMTRQFLERGIGRPEQFTTVRSGMEVGRFLQAAGERAAGRVRLHLRPSDAVIGTVARLAEHKGHDDVLTALLADLRANPGWKLLWVGDGWWRQRLVRRATAESGLRTCQLDLGETPNDSTQLILTGMVSPDEIPGLMGVMDILLHPSLREGLPRTVPQALLAGACPVAYDVDGTREVCIDGETGRLVRPHDMDGLRDAIRMMVASPELRARWVTNGKVLVEREFTVKAMCDGLERVYGI